VIVPFIEVVGRAQAGRRAVGAFTVYGIETAVGVLAAAERRGSDVIILVSAEAFRSRLGRPLVDATRALCEQSTARCCLQLDHATQLDLVSAGFGAGFGAIMVDGSRLSFGDNVKLVQAATEIGLRHGGHIEAELGRVEGDEDSSSLADVGLLTDPDAAGRFMTLTGAACLAVSIGNVHGSYRMAPVLDFERLARVAQSVSQPLSLHGGSGVPPTVLRDAITMGISKINVNTELRRSYFAALNEHMAELQPGAQLLRMGQLVSQRIEDTVYGKLVEFDPALR